MLGAPPAFVLSQDQTLSYMVLNQIFRSALIDPTRFCLISHYKITVGNTQAFSLDCHKSFFRTHGLFCVSSRSLSMNFRVGFFVCMLFNFQGSDHRSFAADLHSTTTSSLCQSLFHNFFELFSFVLLCFFVLDTGFGGAVSRQP